MHINTYIYTNAYEHKRTIVTKTDKYSIVHRCLTIKLIGLEYFNSYLNTIPVHKLMAESKVHKLHRFAFMESGRHYQAETSTFKYDRIGMNINVNYSHSAIDVIKGKLNLITV